MHATTKPMSAKTKRTLKKLSQEAEKAETTHLLRQSHGDLLGGFTHSHTHPMWNRSSLQTATLANWILATTDLKCDLTRRGMEIPGEQDLCCRLCEEKFDESREHILTSCTATLAERNDFLRKVREVSRGKLQEFQNIEESQKCTWILAGGTCREQNPYPIRQNRISPAKSPVLRGDNVGAVPNKNDPLECLRAYNEYRQILAGLEPNHIRVYTDGSYSDTENKTGYGISIILKEGNERRIIRKESKSLGKASVQQAELRAVRDALFWILHEKTLHRKNLPIHVFTDSKYTFHASTTAELRRKHFYLNQEVHNFAHRLKSAGLRVIMHWLPSHIENTAAGKKITGNYFADKLANKGRQLSTPADERDFVHNVREQILSHTITLVEALDKKVKLLNDTPDGPPAVADDLSACAHANRDPLSREVPR